MEAITEGRRLGADRAGSFATALSDACAPVEVVGAGPAGLAAAITVARAGRSVVVHEARREVGYRFRRDLQGLENWSGRRDVLEVPRDVGLSTDFDVATCAHGVAESPSMPGAALTHCGARLPFAAWSSAALGPAALTVPFSNRRFPWASVRFGSRKRTLEGRGIFASGPRAADTIAVSYHFDTCLADGFRGILDDRLAPGGNAYLLSLAGFGMRHAMLSGVLAARSLMDGTEYDASWRREMKRPMETTRAIYGGLGNHGYRWLLRAQAWTADSRAFLGWLYRSARLSRLLLPWAQRRFA
jgi:hypothetical protein